MNGLLDDRWVAGVLSSGLVVSFNLCVISDLGYGATLNETGVVLPASNGITALGTSWLVGCGLHEAAVIAGPLFYLAREKAMDAGIDYEANRVGNSGA